MTLISAGYTTLNAINQLGRDTTIRQLLKPIAHALATPGVNELAINRPGEYWVKTFEGWEAVPCAELTMAYLKSLANAIAVYNGIGMKAINSVILADGERGQINMPPATIDDTCSFNFRTHSSVVKTLEELADDGAFCRARDVSFNQPSQAEADALTKARDFTRLDPFEVELLALKREGKWREFLELCVRHHRNMIISGATGSGKTTFARSLIEKVSPDERIITIEDVHELKLPNHPNRVHMLYGEGAGRVSPKECLRAAMRMTPDRIFPAELRGDEAWEYISSLNTGHPGSITTTHANSAIETYGRVFTLIKSSEVGRGLDSKLIKDEVYKTVHVVLYFERRQLVEVFYDPIFTKSKMAE